MCRSLGRGWLQSYSPFICDDRQTVLDPSQIFVCSPEHKQGCPAFCQSLGCWLRRSRRTLATAVVRAAREEDHISLSSNNLLCFTCLWYLNFYTFLIGQYTGCSYNITFFLAIFLNSAISAGNPLDHPLTARETPRKTLCKPRVKNIFQIFQKCNF